MFPSLPPLPSVLTHSGDKSDDAAEIWPYIKDMAPARMERVLELIAKGPAWLKVLRDTYLSPARLPDGGRIVFVTDDNARFVVAEWP